MTMLNIPSTESTETYARVSQFLALEAILLDDNRVWEWYAMLADDLDYVIPIRETRRRGEGSEFIDGSYHTRDTKGTIKHRIDRLFSGHAWSEDPASRTTRVVGSILITGESEPGEVLVSSNMLVYRERALETRYDIIAAQRNDVIRFADSGPVLAKRVVKLAHTILNTSNLGIFL